jgi:hypothetical protein
VTDFSIRLFKVRTRDGSGKGGVKRVLPSLELGSDAK